MHQDDDFFIEKYLWKIIEICYAEPGCWTTPTNNDRVAKETKKKYDQALSHVQIVLNKILFPRIVGGNMDEDSWKALQESHKRTDKLNVVKIQTLKR